MIKKLSLICLLAVVAYVVAVPNCPETDGAYPTFFPHETSCQYIIDLIQIGYYRWFMWHFNFQNRLYYMCSNQEAHLYNCTTKGGNDAAPIVLHWNVEYKSCDFPESAGCTLAP